MTEISYIDKYFNREEGSYKVWENIRAMTEFRRGNISDPATWNYLDEVDAILCRNVLIYFSDDKVKKTVGIFHESLRPGEYLLLGHFETLTGVYEDLNVERYPETMVYVK